MTEPATVTENDLDAIIDELVVSIAKTMENPPADLVKLIEGIDEPEDSSLSDTVDSEKTMGVELQALIDVVMDE